MGIPYIATDMRPVTKLRRSNIYYICMSKHSERHIAKRLAIDIAGFGLIIIAPFLGWLPGPGGIPIFLAGLGILSLNYDWAENMLKDFEKKRVEFTDRYLVKNKKISWLIDLISIVVIAIGILSLIYTGSLLLRFVSIGLVSLGIIVLISNKRRIDRLVARFRKQGDKSKHKH